LLPGDELVRQTEENLAWPVLPEFAAQRARHHYGLERELPDAGWHVAAAPLAGHDEDFPA